MERKPSILPMVKPWERDRYIIDFIELNLSLFLQKNLYF